MHTRYAITDAPGAMPLIGPRSTLSRMAELTTSPAAVVAVCVPCPSASRGEQVELAPSCVQNQLSPGGPLLTARFVSRNAYAPMSLSLQLNAAPSAGSDPFPNWQS